MFIERVILSAWNIREEVQEYSKWTALLLKICDPGRSVAFIIQHLLHAHVLHEKFQLHRKVITNQLTKCHYLLVVFSALLNKYRFTHIFIFLVELIVIMINCLNIGCQNLFVPLPFYITCLACLVFGYSKISLVNLSNQR